MICKWFGKLEFKILEKALTLCMQVDFADLLKIFFFRKEKQNFRITISDEQNDYMIAPVF